MRRANTLALAAAAMLVAGVSPAQLNSVLPPFQKARGPRTLTDADLDALRRAEEKRARKRARA